MNVRRYRESLVTTMQGSLSSAAAQRAPPARGPALLRRVRHSPAPMAGQCSGPGVAFSCFAWVTGAKTRWRLLGRGLMAVIHVEVEHSFRGAAGNFVTVDDVVIRLAGVERIAPCVRDLFRERLIGW